MNPNFTERIVAFVDIMGFKNLVQESLNSPDTADCLHKALKRIYNLKAANDEMENILSLREYGVEITAFSDSAVISYPIDYEGGFFMILLDVIHLQLELACYGILIRGGIAIGELYHDGHIVYGPAMNEAYRLESQEAVYPRVIVEEKTILEGIEKTFASQNGPELEAEYVRSCIRRDEDGKYFLDMLRQPQELSDFGDEYYLWLSRVRRIIIKGLNENACRPHVLSKYKWLRKYFNSVVADKNAYFPVPDSSIPKEQKKFRKAYGNLKIKKRKHAGDDYT